MSGDTRRERRLSVGARAHLGARHWRRPREPHISGALISFPRTPESPMRPDIAALSEQIETTVALLRRRL
jgi:hypothetical protein